RLSSSGAGMNVYDCVELIIFSRQQDLRLDTVNECFELFQVRSKVITDGLTLTGKLHECLHVIEFPRYLAIEFECFFQAGALLKDFAGAFLIGPEVGIHDLRLQAIELSLLCIRVKETSALPRCG